MCIRDRYCGSSPGQSLLNASLAVAVQAPNDPIFTSGLIGEVYLDSFGLCWTVQLITESPFAGQGVPARDLKQHVGSNCNTCTSPPLLASELQ